MTYSEFLIFHFVFINAITCYYILCSFQTSEPCVQGLLALCALGLLKQDMTLASAVLDELDKVEGHDNIHKQIALLNLYRFTIEVCQSFFSSWTFPLLFVISILTHRTELSNQISPPDRKCFKSKIFYLSL